MLSSFPTLPHITWSSMARVSNSCHRPLTLFSTRVNLYWIDQGHFLICYQFCLTRVGSSCPQARDVMRRASPAHPSSKAKHKHTYEGKYPPQRGTASLKFMAKFTLELAFHSLKLRNVFFVLFVWKWGGGGRARSKHRVQPLLSQLQRKAFRVCTGVGTHGLLET